MVESKMRLDTLEKLRKAVKNEICGEWIGIESYYFNGKWHITCIVYNVKPLRLEVTVDAKGTFVKKVGVIERVPMHVIYLDSALRELENADKFIKNGEFDKAIGSLKGSVVYSLKAYGLISKGCRIVEFSIMDLAKDFSDKFEKYLLNKVKRVQSASDLDDIELLYEDAKDVVEKVIERLL